MNSRKIWSIYLSATLFFLFACGQKKEDTVNSNATKIRVAFWGAKEEVEIIEGIVKKWGKKHPNIKVILEHIPAGEYTVKILTQMAGDSATDVVFAEAGVFVNFFYKNRLLDLTPYVQKDKEFSIKNYFPEVVARFTRNGKIYAIPRDTAPFACIYYNKDLLDRLKIPYPKDSWDWKEFLKIATKLTEDEKGKHPDEQGFDAKKIKRYGFWGWTWQNFVYSNGGKLVDDVSNPKQCLLNEPEAIEGMQFFVDLVHKYHVSPVPDAISSMGIGINQLFAMEKLAMYQSGIWDTPQLRQMIKFNWDVAMFPKGPKGKRAFGSGGSGYAILNTTKHPDEAWEVVKCLAGDEGQAMMAEAGLAQPANQLIANGSHWAGSPKPPLNKKMLNEAVKYIVYEPFHLKWREANDKLLSPQLDLMNKALLPVKKGLDEVVPKINALLQEPAS